MKEEKQIRKLETYIFNELKDCKDNFEYLTKKYEGAGINFERLYKRIINYQIKFYGCTLKDLEKIKKIKSRKDVTHEKNRKNWR